MEQKFYICEHCGNIIAFVENKGVPVMCCGQKMKEIIPGSVDAAKEKHIPVVKQNGNIVTVTVGTVEHPMIEAHYITWISLATKQGNQRKLLTPGSVPSIDFAVTDGDEVIAAYAYCNLHGLWVSKEVE